MAVIYRKSDRVWLNIGDFKIAISPLSYHEKSEVRSLLVEGDLNKAALTCIAYAVKDMEGVQLQDGTPYKLEHDGDKLTEQCLDDILNMGEVEKVSTICISLLEGMPEDFIDGVTGEPIEGVSIINGDSDGKK